jgi:YbbR domain-containing protein
VSNQGGLFYGLLDNLGLKALSFVLAFGFFIFLRGSEREERRFDVAVNYSEPPVTARRVLVKEPPSQISVTLRGPRTMLESLSRDLGTLTLDLSTGHENEVPLTAAMIPNVPEGVEVVQVFPARIDLRWDDIVSRELPVSATRSGEVASGHSVVGQVVVTPQTVQATGPRTIVDLMQVARADTFDSTELGEGFHERTLPLNLPPQGVDYNVASVLAAVQVVREKKTVSFKAVRVEVVGLPEATTKPELVTVRVTGAPDLVTGLDTNQIVPRVELPSDVDTSKKGSRIARVVWTLQGATVELEPKEVLVKW